MQSRLFDLREKGVATGEINTTLSFTPFLQFLEKDLPRQSIGKAKITNKLIATIRDANIPEAPIKLAEITAFETVSELIYLQTSALTDDDNTRCRALSLPLAPVFFYGSDPFYKLAAKEDNASRIAAYHTAAIYSQILAQCYHVASVQHEQDILSFLNPDTGTTAFYSVQFDCRFINIRATAVLPDLNISPAQFLMNRDSACQTLASLLPLDLFEIRGFIITELTDITREHALENIRKLAVKKSVSAKETGTLKIEQLLQVLVRNGHVHFHLYPVNRVNNKVLMSETSRLRRILMAVSIRPELQPEALHCPVESFVNDPSLILFKTLPAHIATSIPGISSIALVPVSSDGKMVGIVEITTTEADPLNEGMVSELDGVLPILSEFFTNSIAAFQAALENIIKEKFTPLQPSVQWKFNEAAWQLMQSKAGTEIPMAPIMFRDVFPLYGAIDIRNSSIERNRALLEDLKIQFLMLQETLHVLAQKYQMPLIDEMMYKCNKWQQRMREPLTSHDEIYLSHLLEVEAVHFLRHFERRGAETDAILRKYIDAINNREGLAYGHRQKLEESIKIINNAVNDYLDKSNRELQAAYPCYFEKFRTDGIEYDIYIGQSIAPERPFDLLYLRNIRLWQLACMASIAKLTRGLISKLPVYLETTQLIFVNTNTIDICFRNDERKFDVEGAYNIRYQLIKKRIDKVHVLGTAERLTVPGKIALIYYNSKDAEEYLPYIEYLQQRKMLQHHIEYLDLEELQGVAGLKAIRIGVNVEEEAV